MPGNIKPINQENLNLFPPVGIRLSKYAIDHTRHTVMSQYPDGSIQVRTDVTRARRTWQIEMRPKAYFAAPETQSQLDALRDFYNSHIGKPFLFTDLHSGQRYPAVFSSAWQETSSPSRYSVALEIQEVY
jgi:hypothetical protein